MARSITSFINDLLFRIECLESTIRAVQKLDGPCVNYLQQDSEKLKKVITEFLLSNLDKKQVENSVDILKHFLEKC